MEVSGVLSSNHCVWSGFRRSSETKSVVNAKGHWNAEIGSLRARGRFSGHGVVRKLSCSHSKSAALESKNSQIAIDEDLILKSKASAVANYLNGRCIYLVGMMGSGKSTVGKKLSNLLKYSFFDCDKLIEKAVGGTSVAQIFMEHGEAFFRDNETKVLQDLFLMRQSVVATGGGAVIRSVNWRYMKHGITVWLDVPLEALARRIAAVGTASRPLLHHEAGDSYTKALLRLHALLEERGDAYANADVRVSHEYIAAKRGKRVIKLKPAIVAVEALELIYDFLASRQLEVQLSRDEA